jgi:ABC-type uncharacterized transport system substrate-binding protein
LAEGDYARFPALIAELIASNVDVIVTAGTPATQAYQKAKTSIPLVMITVGSPRHSPRYPEDCSKIFYSKALTAFRGLSTGVTGMTG